jgi:hypothetical protein
MLRTPRRSRTPLLVPLLGAALFALAACSDTTTGPQPSADTATASLTTSLVRVGARGAKGGVQEDLGSSQPGAQDISLKRGIDNDRDLW